MLRTFSGASVRRTIDRSYAYVPEHAHDWPMLSLFVIGAYSNRTEIGDESFAGPSAVLYRARAAHSNVIAAHGFEQIEIEFDPDWLGRSLLPSQPVLHLIGGWAGAESRRLASICSREVDEELLRAAVRRFVQQTARQREHRPPEWVRRTAQRLSADPIPRMTDLARDVGKHPSWLGTAYRHAYGERLGETVARIRVEHAAQLLRETNVPLASVALEAGFCDQSHMNRVIRRILNRSPSAVREERKDMRQVLAGIAN